MLERLSETHTLCINAIVYAEVSVGFERIEDVKAAFAAGRLQMLQIPREALFLAAKAFLLYRRNKGKNLMPLPDFLIRAHASVEGIALLTRDESRCKTYFPALRLISPKSYQKAS